MSKENLFCSNNVPEVQIFNSWQHQKLLLVANHLQDSTFYINSADIGMSKLVSELKFFLSLFEFKDNDTVVMRTIIKRMQDKEEAP